MLNKLAEIHANVSAEHYDLGIRNNLLQRYWHYCRFKEVLAMAGTIDGQVVDIGCHSGLLTSRLCKVLRIREIYGIDISVQAIKRAKQRIKDGNFIVGDAQKLPYLANDFDAVFCLEMLEHVDFPGKVLKGMYRVLKKSGIALVLVPTDNLLFRTVWFLWNLRYPVWKHVHVQSFRGDLLEEMAKKVGFKVEKVKTFNLGMLRLVKLKKI